MATTYEHISQNKWRTALLVLFFPVSLAILAWITLYLLFVFGGVNASSAQTAQTVDMMAASAPITASVSTSLAYVLPFVWLGAMIWLYVSWYVGAPIVLSGTGAKEISRADNPEIYRLVENLCITRGLPVPKIYIMEDPSLNAFATGRDPEHAIIALTSGIIQKLDKAELEGVIAHELAHVENRDIRLMLLIVAGISFFTLLAEICFRMAASSSRRSGKDKGNNAVFFLVIGIMLTIYGYIVAPLIRLAVSRTREYQADASAALMTRNPGALASALRKISADPRVEALDNRETVAAMCIANPLGSARFFSLISGLWATHPPIEKRIQALLEMDGKI